MLTGNARGTRLSSRLFFFFLHRTCVFTINARKVSIRHPLSQRTNRTLLRVEDTSYLSISYMYAVDMGQMTSQVHQRQIARFTIRRRKTRNVAAMKPYQHESTSHQGIQNVCLAMLALGFLFLGLLVTQQVIRWIQNRRRTEQEMHRHEDQGSRNQPRCRYHQKTPTVEFHVFISDFSSCDASGEEHVSSMSPSLLETRSPAEELHVSGQNNHEREEQKVDVSRRETDGEQQRVRYPPVIERVKPLIYRRCLRGNLCPASLLRSVDGSRDHMAICLTDKAVPDVEQSQFFGSVEKSEGLVDLV